MSTPQVPAQAQAQQAPAAPASFWETYGTTIARTMLIYWAVNQATRYFTGQIGLVPDPAHSPPDPLSNTPSASGSTLNGRLPSLLPLWRDQTSMDLTVYISELEQFNITFAKQFGIVPIWETRDIKFGEWEEERSFSTEVEASKSLQNNGTIYAHIYLSQQGAPLDIDDPKFNANYVVNQTHLLNYYYPKPKLSKKVKLVGDSSKHEGPEEEEEEEEEEEVIANESHDTTLSSAAILSTFIKKRPLVSFWHPNLTIAVVADSKSILPYESMPIESKQYISLERNNARDPSGKYGYYLPVIYPNDFWNLKDHMFPINKTVTTLPLTITYAPISLLKFQLYSKLSHSMKEQQNSLTGGASASEFDEIKRMWLETNPILLGTTLVVSLFHSLFEFLAFKNDIAFWSKKKDQIGVSVRTLLVNIFFSTVIFLYLLDNNENTSWMILIGQGIGLVIEMWKVWRALKWQFIPNPTGLLPYRILFAEENPEIQMSEEEAKTAEYDQLAFKYLTWLAYPLLVGYAIYSLLYDSHKSWYSYVLGTLVGFVYMFGFITMTPQLFINYKLKSIAHMPWKTLMYKSLNTFIDDLFAFCIKMPTLHRLACLRDDVVFFVYLYQKWAYKVDPTRVNEYGQVGEVVEVVEKEKEKEGETKKDK